MDVTLKRYVLGVVVVSFKSVLAPKASYEAWLDRLFNASRFVSAEDSAKADKQIRRRIAQTTLVDNAIEKVYAHKS